MKTLIDYYSAVHWCNNALVQFQEITKIDPEFEEKIGTDEDGNQIEIYQYFITDMSEWDAEFLKDTFPDLIIIYSDKIEKYILCVDHFGTAWDYVWTECKLPKEVLPKFNDKGIGETKTTRIYETKFKRY